MGRNKVEGGKKRNLENWSMKAKTQINTSYRNETKQSNKNKKERE